MTANLTKAIGKYVSDTKLKRQFLLPELITTVPMSKFQTLAAIRLFRELFNLYMHSGLMFIFYVEVVLTYKLKLSKNFFVDSWNTLLSLCGRTLRHIRFRRFHNPLQVLIIFAQDSYTAV